MVGSDGRRCGGIKEAEGEGRVASEPVRKGIDWLSAVMALVTGVAVAWTVWLRYGPEAAVEPPAVGGRLPALRLQDARTGEPAILFGMQGRVVWVTFWSTRAEPELSELTRVWKRLGSRRGFTMVAAAVDEPSADRVRQILEKQGSDLPIYRAPEETRRRFGVDGRNLPLHVLVDEQGTIGAVARGVGRETVTRLIEQAEAWLDEMEPLGKTRFARVRLEMRSGRFG